jgi:hypothetical protein
VPPAIWDPEDQVDQTENQNEDQVDEKEEEVRETTPVAASFGELPARIAGYVLADADPTPSSRRF